MGGGRKADCRQTTWRAIRRSRRILAQASPRRTARPRLQRTESEQLLAQRLSVLGDTITDGLNVVQPPADVLSDHSEQLRHIDVNASKTTVADVEHQVTPRSHHP